MVIISSIKNPKTISLLFRYFRNVRYSTNVSSFSTKSITPSVLLPNCCRNFPRYDPLVNYSLKNIVRSSSYCCNLRNCAKTHEIQASRTYKSTMPPTFLQKSPQEIVERCISENKVFIFSKSFCPFCFKVKAIFRSERIGFDALELDLIENGAEIQEALFAKSGQKTVPNVYINGEHVGGSDKVQELHSKGELITLLNPKTHSYDYDYIVIGGGSGGLASSKEAARLGAKVAVCDFVKPTPIGTTWGLGGTCVNVGCIPKKLMHQAAILGHDLKDSREFGWSTPEKPEHNWNTMVEGIQNHIGSLNWGYRVALRDKKIDYLNAFATFVDEHTIKTVDKKGKEKTLTSNNFLIAVGGRPRYPDIPGAKEFGITSDDIFSLPYSPGKTLLVGASYISLECAGFLHGLGYDVTVMVRSILLRGFDRQMSEKIGEIMEQMGVKFLRETIPTSVERIEEGQPGKLKVTAKTRSGGQVVDEYNTVVFAIGRDPFISELGLENIGVQLAKSGKIVVDKREVSSVSNVYAVGDVIDGGLELTPVAIQAGKLLARRLYGNGKELMDYVNVPTTVFTAIEYGCCGLSEEAAVEKFGEANIDVYHSNFWPLEFTVAHRPENDCYAKLVVLRKEGEEFVIGFHYLGPNAGEVTQGFSIALKLNATKSDFDNLVGIHPTCAEVFTTLTITKRSGKDVASQGC
ncbi:Thioredoxin reductase 3 [Armadillidium nasatum]|uniref:thioredoxin-disulfide reductase (NADPH) n=1 Tax=Armadillidium nasatum TaxID=96803 RepID=A0A5N5SR22_9CRUS|nr:Thioredoxin reductase 3 [Armadillidium nasatum]